MPLPPEVIPLVPAPAPGAPETIVKLPANTVNATLITAEATPNSNIKLTAQLPGDAGNGITFVTGNSSDLLVEVTGRDIVVQLNTGVSTAGDVIAAINANPLASALVFAENAPGNNGSGIIDPGVFGTLSGGGQTAPPINNIPKTPATPPGAPSTISKTPAGPPGAPATISLTPASNPAAPGVIRVP